MKKSILLVVMLLVCLGFASCDLNKNNENKIKNDLIEKFGINDTEKITINFYGNLENFSSLQDVITDFNEYFPNVNIEYSYKDNYGDTMLSLLKDEETTKTTDIYLSYQNIISTMIDDGSIDKYAIDYYDVNSKIDVSSLNKELCLLNTHDGKLYDVPSMVNARGLCVNKTLLRKYGLETPTNWTEFLHCCEVIKNNGLLPIQCHPNDLGICLAYPKIGCDIVYNEDYQNIFVSMNNFTAGSGEYLRDNFNLILTICENGYYDYEVSKSIVGSYTPAILNFFEGDVAFLPCTIETFSGMKKREANYNDTEFGYGETKYDGFEYEYVGSPAGDSPYIYWMPYNGITLNPSSTNHIWAQAFIDFLFREENLQKLAEGKGMYTITNNNTDPRYEKISQIKAPYQTNQGRFTITYFSEIRYAFEKMYKKDAKVCNENGNLDLNKVVEYFEGKISSKRAK